jgi:threonine synthase
METNDAVAGLRCPACDAAVGIERGGWCPDCGGALDVALETGPADRDAFAGGVWGLARYEAVLPFPATKTVSTGAGGTPLIACPDLAADFGVASLHVKDEGQNPTGSVADRGAALAVTAAREQGATDVALPSMGNTAQAVAASAARVGLASHSFVPSRTPFVNKAMINVHGGDMTVVGGRFADAAAAFQDALQTADWHPVDPFTSPFRHEGATTAAYELIEQRDWAVPDAVVVPTGHGTTLVGLALGFERLRAWGLVTDTPEVYAAQAAGCAPIAEAWAAGEASHSPVEAPDTICGPLEIPDPAGGERVLHALADSGGGAVAAEDEALLAGAVALAEAGVTAGVSAGAGLAGAELLVESGALGPDDEVVLLNPTSGTKEADLLRSHLMSRGQ